MKPHSAGWVFSIAAGLVLSMIFSLAGTLAEDFKFANGNPGRNKGGSGFAGAWMAGGIGDTKVSAANNRSFTGGGYTVAQTDSSGSFYSTSTSSAY